MKKRAKTKIHMLTDVTVVVYYSLVYYSTSQACCLSPYISPSRSFFSRRLPNVHDDDVGIVDFKPADSSYHGNIFLQLRPLRISVYLSERSEKSLYVFEHQHCLALATFYFNVEIPAQNLVNFTV